MADGYLLPGLVPRPAPKMEESEEKMDTNIVLRSSVRNLDSLRVDNDRSTTSHSNVNTTNMSNKSPTLMQVFDQSFGLVQTLHVLQPLSRLAGKMSTLHTFKELQEALLFVVDNSAAHRIATLRYSGLSEHPQVDVSYIGTGKYIRQCVATDNIQRPFRDMYASSINIESHLAEVSVYDSNRTTSDDPLNTMETNFAGCWGINDFFSAKSMLQFLSLFFETFQADDMELKASIIRDFPLFYLELEKILFTSRLTFCKEVGSNFTNHTTPRPRLIEANIPIDLTKLGNTYPELSFYLRYFVDSSTIDFLSMDGKKRILGIAWNYAQSKFEVTCIKRGQHLVWHDPKYLTESMVVAQMKGEIDQMKGGLVGDDVDLAPGFTCLARIVVKLRPLGLAAVSFSSIDLHVEIEPTAAGASDADELVFSLRMDKIEGVLGSATKMLALEKDVLESFRIRVGIVPSAEVPDRPEHSSAVMNEEDDEMNSAVVQSMFGVRFAVSARQSSVMSWWSSFVVNRIMRGGVVAELLLLVSTLLKAFCEDIKNKMAPPPTLSSSSSAAALQHQQQQQRATTPTIIPVKIDVIATVEHSEVAVREISNMHDPSSAAAGTEEAGSNNSAEMVYVSPLPGVSVSPLPESPLPENTTDACTSIPPTHTDDHSGDATTLAEDVHMSATVFIETVAPADVTVHEAAPAFESEMEPELDYRSLLQKHQQQSRDSEEGETAIVEASNVVAEIDGGVGVLEENKEHDEAEVSLQATFAAPIAQESSSLFEVAAESGGSLLTEGLRYAVSFQETIQESLTHIISSTAATPVKPTAPHEIGAETGMVFTEEISPVTVPADLSHIEPATAAAETGTEPSVQQLHSPSGLTSEQTEVRSPSSPYTITSAPPVLIFTEDHPSNKEDAQQEQHEQPSPLLQQQLPQPPPPPQSVEDESLDDIQSFIERMERSTSH